MCLDYFGFDAMRLKEKQLFLFDMDGTIYEDDVLFEGAAELFVFLERMNKDYVFITNNSSKSVDVYIDKLKKLGVHATKKNFFTSTLASIEFLQRNHNGEKIYCQGTKAFLSELRANAICATEEVCDDAKAILVGFDLELSSEKLRKTCKMLTLDIPFYATNLDLACPVEFGFVPDCGSICQMLENATKRAPKYFGKPDPILVDFVMQKFQVSVNDTVVIGDRLYTDIAVGVNAGVDTICVLTGEAVIDDITTGIIKPTFTFESILDVYNIMRQM